ncbi:MAG TPA: hypothetical protein VFB30_19400 [Spirochaetia bacterium]|nr:hypothetical protein [Spirochaetia bacterium]
MKIRAFSVLAATGGLLGAAMLVASFSLNVGPAPDMTSSAQLIAFGRANFSLVLWGAWLQAIGPVFIVLFAFAIVYLSGAGTRVAGWMTIFGTCTLMTVSLVEIVFYMSALNSDPESMSVISLELIRSVQHLYFIVAAPALFLPLGVVILGADVLPRILGYLALALGAAFGAAGMITLHDLVVPVAVQASASIQVIWWLAAAVTLIVRSGRQVAGNEADR